MLQVAAAGRGKGANLLQVATASQLHVACGELNDAAHRTHAHQERLAFQFESKLLLLLLTLLLLILLPLLLHPLLLLPHATCSGLTTKNSKYALAMGHPAYASLCNANLID